MNGFVHDLIQRMAPFFVRSKVSRAMRRSLLGLLLVSTFNRGMLAQPTLSIDTLPNGTEGKVTFTPFLLTSPLSNAPENEDQYKYKTTDGKYLMFVNPSTITWAPLYVVFTFEVKIKSSAPGDATWYTYKVKANMDGSFPDQEALVTCRINDSIAYVNLPVHSFTYRDDLAYKPGDSAMVDVKVSDPRGLDIPLQNSLEKLDIHVTTVKITKSKCYSCWDDLTPKPRDLVIHPSDTAHVPLSIQPKSLAAMFSTALILKRSQSQDTLSVTVGYTVEPGGMPKEKQLDIPVRFTPSIWQLGIAVIVGAIVGAFLKRLLDHEVDRITLKLALKVVFVALVAEFIAVLAASFDSKVIILSVDMDPRQVVPAAVLAFVITGGPTVTKWAARIMRPGGPAPDQAATTAAGGGSES